MGEQSERGESIWSGTRRAAYNGLDRMIQHLVSSMFSRALAMKLPIAPVKSVVKPHLAALAKLMRSISGSLIASAMPRCQGQSVTAPGVRAHALGKP
jgi:MoxR-like ATPase